MKRYAPYILAMLLIVALIGGSWATVSGSSNPYELSWFTIDGGGTMFSDNGPYALGSTIGQPDAGGSSNGPFAVNGGFWFVAQTNTYQVYLPAVIR